MRCIVYWGWLQRSSNLTGRGHANFWLEKWNIVSKFWSGGGGFSFCVFVCMYVYVPWRCCDMFVCLFLGASRCPEGVAWAVLQARGGDGCLATWDHTLPVWTHGRYVKRDLLSSQNSLLQSLKTYLISWSFVLHRWQWRSWEVDTRSDQDCRGNLWRNTSILSFSNDKFRMILFL